MIKLLSSLLFYCSVGIQVSAGSELNLKLDLARSDQANIASIIDQTLSHKNLHKLIFEFSDSGDSSKLLFRAAVSGQDKVYSKNYPNGDFYYLIGDLDDEWSKSDFARFYSVAKWLARRGFRTIINVVAYAPDLEEALSNPRTSAMIWNSHGNKNGSILDTNKVSIGSQTFEKFRTPNLKYVLFANCWGHQSAHYYGLKKLPKIVSEGWDREATSEDLFGYIFSNDFDAQLEKALGRKLIEKSQKSIVSA